MEGGLDVSYGRASRLKIEIIAGNIKKNMNDFFEMNPDIEVLDIKPLIKSDKTLYPDRMMIVYKEGRRKNS